MMRLRIRDKIEVHARKRRALRKPRALVASAIIALSGCAHLPWQILPTETGIDQLRKQHRYVTALKALDARKKNISDYEQTRAEIIADANQYQAELLKQANALIQQQQFAKAQSLLATDPAELPPSPELTQFEAQFDAARERYIQRSFDELVQQRAPGLAREHAAYSALAKGATTPELRSLVERHQADVDYFAPLIAKLGNQALAQNDYERAAQYLAIADQLTPSTALAKQLKTAERGIALAKQKQQTARSNEREQRYRDLQVQLQKSLSDRDFFVARDLIVQAKALNIHGDELDAMQRDLDDAIALYVNQQIDAGNHEYADGRIEAALQNWRAANALIPTADLQDKIDKAQKFIERLQQLQNPPK